MEINTKDNSWKARNKGMVNIIGRMVGSIRDGGTMVSSMGLGYLKTLLNKT